MAQMRPDMRTETPVRGRLTYTDLGQTVPFFLPWEPDPWGRLRPPFSLDLLRMSLELSNSAYDLKINDWMQAGWTDFTFQVDNELLSGISNSGVEEPKQFLYNKWAVHKARSQMRQWNPVRQVLGAVRQRQQSDTGKALVMIRPCENGRYVVAIGFRGTGGRIYDWFSNFRFLSENGIHQGFLQLTKQFESNAERITFPETARALGLENLTLSHILEESKSHNSRFVLWLSGHSQGAAVMQVWTHLQIMEGGVLPENIVGYGFASPTVMMGRAVSEPSAYPLYHIINSDDYVSRSGAQIHLGVCLVYPAGEDIRKAAYGWRDTPQAIHERAVVRRLTRRMVDLPSMIESGIAYMQVLESRPLEDVMAALNLLNIRLLPIRQMLSAAGTRTQDVLRFVRRRIIAAYQNLTGRDIDPVLLNSLKAQIESVIDEIGIGPLSKTIGEMMYWPHLLRPGAGKGVSGYQYIVLRGVRDLHPAIWQCGSPPVRLWLEPPMEKASAAPSIADISALVIYNKRLQPAARKTRAQRLKGYSSRRAVPAPRNTLRLL